MSVKQLNFFYFLLYIFCGLDCVIYFKAGPRTVATCVEARHICRRSLMLINQSQKVDHMTHLKLAFIHLCFCPKRLTVIHTLVAAMQGADQHIRSSLGFSILPEVTSTSRPGESNQRPSSNKTLALQSYSRSLSLMTTP